jgi:zinc protease
MKLKNYFILITLPALILFLSIGSLLAQTAKFPAPREKKLLNDLKLLTWSSPDSEKVTVKLRIHSGSAFDPKDKEGTMVLLGNILFPGEVVKQSFIEDLGGSLEIVNTYDYIQINATANKNEILTVLETISNAILNPLIDKENTSLVKNSQIEKLKELEKDSNYIADQAVKEKLFGDFPYGRSVNGNIESLEKIDFADIIFARQKFLTADNATLVVVGDVDTDLVYKAVRRYFGNWVKADEKTPAYFRIPDEPEKKIAIVDSPISNTSELRYAFRGLARNDKDYFPSEIMAKVLQNRLQEREPNKIKVENIPHFLPGYVLVSSNNWNLGKIQRVDNMISLPTDFNSKVSDALKAPVTNSEFEKAKFNQNPKTLDNYSEWWLDADTYRLSTVKNELQNSEKVSFEDVNRVAEKWRKETVVGVLLITEKESKPEMTPEKTDN